MKKTLLLMLSSSALLLAVSVASGAPLAELYQQALEKSGAQAKTELAAAVAMNCSGEPAATYSVQLWALANYYYAEAKKELALPVRLLPFMKKGRVLYRVVSGCFADRQTAAAVCAVLRDKVEAGAHVLDLSKYIVARDEMAELVKGSERDELLGHALSQERLVALFQLYEEGIERDFIWRLMRSRPEARPLVLEAAVRFNLAGEMKVTPSKKEIGFFLEKAETDAALYYLEKLAREYPLDVFRSARGVRQRLRQKTYHAILLRCRAPEAFSELYRACLTDARENYLRPTLDSQGRNRSLHFQLGLDLLYKRREEFRKALREHIEDEDEAVRLYCAEYLGRMGDRRGYQLVIDSLAGESTRLASIRALAELGGREALGLIKPFMEDSNSAEVRNSARRAVVKIEERFTE